MSSKYWIKLYHEILDDPKMGRLDDRSYRRTIELFLLAGETDAEGELPSVEDISWRLRIPYEEITDDLTSLKEVGILSEHDGLWSVTNFSDRQSAMDGKERTRRYREEKQKEEYYGDETVTNRHTDIDTDIDIDTDKELNNTDDTFQSVWEVFSGKPVAAAQAFFKMVDEFKKAGVTPEIYRQALQEQKKSEYSVTNPTSVRSWALGLVKEKKAPRKYNRKGDDPEARAEHNARVIQEVINEFDS